VARFYPEFDPQKIMKMALIGQEKILEENLIWSCSSCYLCTERCPEDANPTGVILSLKHLSLKKKLAKGVGPRHVKGIVSSIKRYGLLDEGMIPFQAKGWLSAPFVALGFTRMGLKMFWKRKLPIPYIIPRRDPFLKEIYANFTGEKKK
jgi:heterodisulfide reductase subunit C